MKERRSHPRVQSSHPVLYFSDTHPKSRVSETLDISLGGTRMQTTPFTPMIGEGLDVSIAIHPRAVKCRGKVVHLLQVLDERAVGGVRVEAGVSFEEMSEDNEVYLRGYLTDLLEQKASGRSRKRTSV